jgi:protein-L-isoaspartate(D-aspartate) O-methyltransferase
MVDLLRHHGTITSREVEQAFLALPREEFVPQILAESGLEHVYADDALVTRKLDGVPVSSSSQPSIMALMLEALDLRPGLRVLEVGLGTGYNAALLRRLVGPDGAVTSVDIAPDVVTEARAALGRVGLEVETVVGDGAEGFPASAPYDRIIATASTAHVPPAWWEQLAPDGIVVVPLRFGGMQTVAVLVRTPTGFRTTRTISGGFMAMRPAADAPSRGGVTVTVDTNHGDGRTSYLSIAGTGVDALSEVARAAMVGNLLAPPRRLAVTGAFPIRALIWQAVMSTSIERQVVVFDHEHGSLYGTVDPSGAVAAMRTRPADGGAVLGEIELYGAADDLGAVLLSAAEAWHAAGRPELDRLALAIDFDSVAPMPSWAASVSNPHGQRWCLGWS